jgi:hypothetical protein
MKNHYTLDISTLRKETNTHMSVKINEEIETGTADAFGDHICICGGSNVLEFSINIDLDNLGVQNWIKDAFINHEEIIDFIKKIKKQVQ